MRTTTVVFLLCETVLLTAQSRLLSSALTKYVTEELIVDLPLSFRRDASPRSFQHRASSELQGGTCVQDRQESTPEVNSEERQAQGRE
ncbi:hypothetical protein PM082_012365 [Marasmius tenuissimus]|nr:hypothetical protein PM082_012365 [Marasmius tenuissimus]